MGAAAIVTDILRQSGLTKTEMSERTGVSRSLLDGYLKGQRQPPLAQIERLADAGGLRLDVRIEGKPRPVSAEYVAVMQLAGQMAGKRDTLPPLDFPHDVWRTRRAAVPRRA
jgi:transcriptional regulator with XRE-family HTH domain